jgi:hypothetical protein
MLYQLSYARIVLSGIYRGRPKGQAGGGPPGPPSPAGQRLQCGLEPIQRPLLSHAGQGQAQVGALP